MRRWSKCVCSRCGDGSVEKKSIFIQFRLLFKGVSRKISWISEACLWCGSTRLVVRAEFSFRSSSNPRKSIGTSKDYKSPKPLSPERTVKRILFGSLASQNPNLLLANSHKLIRSKTTDKQRRTNNDEQTTTKQANKQRWNNQQLNTSGDNDGVNGREEGADRKEEVRGKGKI